VLNPLSVSDFLDVGPAYVDGELLEQWISVLPPNSPFPFIKELWLVNETSLQHSTLAFMGNTVAVPGFPNLLSFSTNFTDTVVGEPAAAIFAVRELATCPLAFDCDDAAERLASRAATGRLTVMAPKLR
jgi:hypothetical protein